MRVLALVLQVVLSLVLAASLTPVVLVTVPPAREGRVGLVLVGTILLVSFLLLRLVWPRRLR